MNLRLIAITSCYLFLASTLIAQTDRPLELNKKRITAHRVDLPPSIDGRLDDEVWQQTEVATDFIQFRPKPGLAPSQRTEVRVVYTNVGIYVGAYLYDSQPDSIQQEVTQRDNIGNTDFFGLIIDTYRDGNNGFTFIATPADVQFDARFTSNNGEDESWDAVWRNKAQRNSDGWSVEIEIPYSAIRFPSESEQTWHLNFTRRVARNQEQSFWNEVDPAQNGFLNQAGYLVGLQDIKSPPRIQATPFIAVYGLHHHDSAESPTSTLGYSLNGGMDVKVGLNDAFTLDMTLIPDFGEAISDNQVLNLSPFEIQFNENRAFFTEGTELFSKGNLFYSRRIGGTPLRYYEVGDQLADGEEIVSNPQRGRLFNATKVSGRTAKGTGIGLFNATSGRTVARIRDNEGGEREFETDPLTNFNVLVIDQNLPHNSSATFINTTVWRNGAAYDANVTGGVWNLQNKKNTYALRGKAVLSQRYETDDTALGHTLSLNLRKTSGNVQAGLDYNEESDTYDPNDLGILFNNNERSVSGFVEYNQFEPFGGFNNGGVGVYMEYNRLYNPNAYANAGVNVWAYAQGKNFWRYNVWTYISPGNNYDYFEPREPGRYVLNPTSGNIGYFIGTDDRKQIRVSSNANYWRSARSGQYNGNLSHSVRYRASDKLNMTVELDRRVAKRDQGFVNNVSRERTDPVTGELLTEQDIIIGERDRRTWEIGLRTNYTFDANMALSFRLRHYWTTVTYSQFYNLEQNGTFGETDYREPHDIDYDAFNIDLIYRWRFAPGSDLFVIYKNNINSFTESPQRNYWKNLDTLWGAPQDNSLSIKLIYFLDYASIVNRG